MIETIGNIIGHILKSIIIFMLQSVGILLAYACIAVGKILLYIGQTLEAVVKK